MTQSESVKIFAPATVANVACGYDILGFALKIPGDELVVRKVPEPGVRIVSIAGAEGLPMEPEKNVAGVAILAVLADLKSDAGFEIELTKGVKPGSGIGSSAASSAGAAFAANELLGKPYSRSQLVRFAMEGEKLVSGVAHADNVAPCLLGGFTLVRSYNPLDIIPIQTPEELFCTVIHPQVEVRTADARGILPEMIDLKEAVKQWGNVAGLVAGLMANDYDLIGRSMEDVIVEPVRSILIPLFPEVKRAALAAGALGASISGSGPSMFALSRGEETARAVADAMQQAFEPSGLLNYVHVSAVNPEGVCVRTEADSAIA